jgi:hypothetical protein
MPRTVDNIGFYSRLGFVPGHLTLTMTREVQRARGGQPPYVLLGGLAPGERGAWLAEIAALVRALAPGYDFSREIQLTLDLVLGNVVMVRRDGRLAAFALCHSAPLAESGTREELRVLKVAATGTESLVEALDAVAAWAASQSVRRVAVRCQTAYREAYQALIKSEFRVRWSDLRMTLAGYPEPVPASGILWSNWEI